MEEYILKKCKACQFQIHKIARIHKYLSKYTCACLIQGLDMSKLEYANCLQVGINKTFLNQLHVVQNSVARVIMKIRKSDYIVKVRQELHWFPVQERIDFSVLTNVYNALHGLGPPFISDLLSLSQSSRHTRSPNSLNLTYPVNVPGNNNGKWAFVLSCSYFVEQSYL